MSSFNGFTRRGILKTTGIGGIALAAGAGASVFTSFSAEGASAPINVVTSNSTLTNTLFNIMASQKYFDEFGISINTVHVADGSMTMPALLGGQSDICVINGIGLALATMAKGAAMKIVGSTCLLTQLAVYSAKPEIKTLKDLEGKVVGTGAIGALTYQLVVALLQKKGVDVSKVTFRNVGSNTDIFRAAAAGTVDAGPSGIDVYNEQAKYGVHSLSDGNFWTELPEYTYQGSYALNHAIETKRDGLVRVLAVLAKLFQFIQSPGSKDAWLSAYAAAAGKPNVQAATDAWNFIQKYKPYVPDLRFSEKRLAYMQNLNKEFDLQKTIAPYSQIVDMSIAHDAVKLAKI